MDCFCKLGAHAALNNKMQFQGLQFKFNLNSEIKELVCCVGSVEKQIEIYQGITFHLTYILELMTKLSAMPLVVVAQSVRALD